MRKILIGCAIALSALGLGFYLNRPRLLVEYSKSGNLLPPDPSVRIQPALADSAGNFDAQGIYHPVITQGRLGYPYLPDPKLTPGAINPDVPLNVMCQRGFSKTIRHTSGSLKHQIYEEYGISHHQRGQWEIDHIIPLENNGSDVRENLFPQPLHVNWNGYEVGFKVKDEFENFMHNQVCTGQIDLRTAQAAFSQNWIEGRLKYMGSLPEYPYP